ncbi:S-layer homology domain-containing protein [Sporosarcina sp. E16_8]|uniref:S-layer homology domain-containing protein n=1 Tax=Sporosarcina sp. E16_8 TaxID=2789295 RepID=UPI001A92AB55|nr:S-layer homology domain-containing protein [Sporosarcina sp. E16_8]MBO0587679.1 S-layer homology domain-containing protein [Sporosarcina sp. E16_8]
MVKTKFKFRLLFVVALMIQMIVVPYHFSAAEIDTSAPSWALPIDYLAIGDSLAAGVTPNNELGKGYADFLAESIREIGALKTYNKGFSYPGYKTTDVLNDIKLNVTKDIYGIGFEEKSAKLQQAIKDAEVITISAGANDILPLLKQDPVTGKATIDQKVALITLQQVGTNYKSIMAQINEINPDAQVYVMGYYNPFPYMSEDIQPLLKQLLDMLNKAIATGLVGTQAIFVPTGEVIASDYKTYLPNPENIHLSEAGYKKVTEQFWTNMRTANPGIEAGNPVVDPTTPTPTPIVFSDIANHGLKNYIEQAAAARIIGGYADGTFKPDQNLTRVQAVSLIVSALGLKTEDVAPFGDIGNYADKTKADINAAYKYGVIKGDKGNFNPTDLVTRAQLALMIERAYGSVTGKAYKASTKAPYSDFGNYNAEVVNAISMLHELDVATGFEGKFMPSSSTSRAQAAKMVVNFISIFKQAE